MADETLMDKVSDAAKGWGGLINSMATQFFDFFSGKADSVTDKLAPIAEGAANIYKGAKGAGEALTNNAAGVAENLKPSNFIPNAIQGYAQRTGKGLGFNAGTSTDIGEYEQPIQPPQTAINVPPAEPAKDEAIPANPVTGPKEDTINLNATQEPKTPPINVTQKTSYDQDFENVASKVCESLFGPYSPEQPQKAITEKDEEKKEVQPAADPQLKRVQAATGLYLAQSGNPACMPGEMCNPLAMAMKILELRNQFNMFATGSTGRLRRPGSNIDIEPFLRDMGYGDDAINAVAQYQRTGQMPRAAGAQRPQGEGPNAQSQELTPQVVAALKTEAGSTEAEQKAFMQKLDRFRKLNGAVRIKDNKLVYIMPKINKTFSTLDEALNKGGDIYMGYDK